MIVRTPLAAFGKVLEALFRASLRCEGLNWAQSRAKFSSRRKERPANSRLIWSSGKYVGKGVADRLTAAQDRAESELEGS